jgi:hypothetical protein
VTIIATARGLGRTSAFSRRECAQVLVDFPPLKREGAGNAGRSMHPQPRMQNKKAYECSHHGHTGFARHSLRNGFNGFLRALPGDRALLPPSLADRSANLMPASGHQNHTTSSSASALFVSSAMRVHRISPRVRDDRDTPLCGSRQARFRSDLGQAGKELFFQKRLDC